MKETGWGEKEKINTPKNFFLRKTLAIGPGAVWSMMFSSLWIWEQENLVWGSPTAEVGVSGLVVCLVPGKCEKALPLPAVEVSQAQGGYSRNRRPHRHMGPSKPEATDTGN